MIVIDIFNLIYRAIAVAVSQNSEDLVYGDLDITFMQIFFKMFNKLFRNFKGQKIIIAWEGKEKNYRFDIYPQYKGNREHSLKNRINENYFDELKEGLIYYGCVILEHPNAEGDDIIYAVCDSFQDEPEITVISADEDFIQLLNKFNNVKLFNPTKKKYIETPQYDYVKFKAIKGDASDNIKGLSGFGNVKAKNVLNNYQTFWDSLNESSKAIISKNLELIDLSRNPRKDEIKTYVQETYQENTSEFSFKKITQFVMKHRMRDIYSKLHYELDNFIKN